MRTDQGRNPSSGKPEPLAPLPRGRHLLPPEEVERHQRERILHAVATGMAERGYATLTVASIIAEARVSRTTFYAQFANKKEAVVGTYEETFRRFLALVEAACATEEEWPMKLRRGLEVTVGFAAAEPSMALLLAAQAEVADRVVAEKMLAARRRLVELLLHGRSYPGADLLPEITEEALVGAIAAVISRAVLDGSIDDADALRAQLVEFVLVFY
ncbi:MAG TPA: TetR/AcrR family transcriptional regulator [Solirubrobacterales bacterium]|nr:TetR/AcrR family transcriptional regulator [Solirubrobacterales bacterium]